MNATVSDYWSRVVDGVQGGTAELARILFERVVLPAGQSLLHHTELAAQYTLNGDYEVSNIDPFILSSILVCISFNVLYSQVKYACRHHSSLNNC